MVTLFTIKHICNCEMIPKHMTCLLKKPDAVLVPYAAIIPKPTMLSFVSTELWAGVDIRGVQVTKKQSPWVPLF